MKRIKRKNSLIYIDEERGKNIIEEAFRKGVLLKVKTGGWGNRKVLKDIESDETLPKNIVKATKTLIDKEALDRIQRLRILALKWAHDNSLPWLDDAIYFVPKGKIEEGVQYINKLIEKLKEEVEELITNYEKLKSKRKEEIQGTKLNWEEKDYPSIELLRNKFYIRYQFFYLNVPEFGVLSEEQIKEEKEKLNKETTEAINLGILALRKSFTEMVLHLSKVLKEGKRLHVSSIDKLKAFFSEFKDLNVWGDADLGTIVERCNFYLDGVDVEDLREDESFKKQISKQLDEVVVEIKGLKDEKLTRSIEF